MYSDVYAFTVLPKTKAKVLKISNCKYADCPTFLSVHFQLQFLLEILDTGFQQSFWGSLAFGEQYNVIRVANTRYTSSFELPVEFIEIDIGKQGGKIPALCKESNYAK